MSLIGYTPYERSLLRGFGDLLDDFNRMERSLNPYWRHVTADRQFSLGNVMGEIENTKDHFAVKVDCSQFQPEELKVNVNGKELTIEGHHEEKNDAHGSIQRSFIRKFVLPEDANVESIRSSLSNDGHLTIETPKKSLEGPQSRAIPITRG